MDVLQYMPVSDNFLISAHHFTPLVRHRLCVLFCHIVVSSAFAFVYVCLGRRGQYGRIVV